MPRLPRNDDPVLGGSALTSGRDLRFTLIEAHMWAFSEVTVSASGAVSHMMANLIYCDFVKTHHSHNRITALASMHKAESHGHIYHIH